MEIVVEMGKGGDGYGDGVSELVSESACRFLVVVAANVIIVIALVIVLVLVIVI